MAVRVSDKSVREVLGIVREMIDRFGARVTGTAACRGSALDIQARLEPLCDRTETQEFVVRPGPMWRLGLVIGGCYCVAVLMMCAGGAWVWGAAAAATLSIAYWINVSVLMVGTLDIFFRPVRGINVWGTIEPAGEVRRQVYVVGHHDTARVLNFLQSRFQKWYAIRIFGAIVFSLTQLFSAWAWVGYRFAHGADPGWAVWAAGAGVAGLVFLGPLLFFVGPQGSPGAGDNLIASAMGIGIAQVIRGPGGTGRLKHTRLVVLSLDAEEPGMRGAGAFLRTYADELKKTRTSVLNFDAIYQAEHLTLLTRDRNGFKALSAEMTAQCAAIAKKIGHTIAAVPVTFGGGGTDAVRFADYGIEVASIIGISTNFIREGLVYHTVNDTVDKLDPHAVKVCMEIAVNYIREKDTA